MPSQTESEPEISTASVFGSVIVVVASALQPLVSVTVTPYVPAAMSVAVLLLRSALSLHTYVYGSVPPETVAVAVVVPPLQEI